MRHRHATWIMVSLAAACAPALWAQSPPEGPDGTPPAGDAAGAPTAMDRRHWLERWLFNADERTRRALARFEAGDAEGAVEPLDTALRLLREEPLAWYNAGAARLEAGRGDAEPLLSAAAERGPEVLAPLAHYNLGNARLAENDFQGAIEAYRQALRHDGELYDAKFNLELAQRRLEEQQEQQQEQQSEQQSEPPSEPQQEQPSEQQPDSQLQDSQQPEDPRTQDSQPDRQDPPPEPKPDEAPRQRPQESPLPQFRDLPDMTAEEAAAILEAIENMERAERRQEALEAAAQNRRAKKDW